MFILLVAVSMKNINFPTQTDSKVQSEWIALCCGGGRENNNVRLNLINSILRRAKM
jgi:hypothetical protein